jgi:hypothetical protein
LRLARASVLRVWGRVLLVWVLLEIPTVAVRRIAPVVDNFLAFQIEKPLNDE